MIRKTSRRKLWMLTLLIWLVGGGFVFHRCSVEGDAISKQAVTLTRDMAARYERAAGLLKKNPGKKSAVMRVKEVGMAHGIYLKKIKALHKRLFWKDLYKAGGMPGARKDLDSARKAYLAALRQRRK